MSPHPLWWNPVARARTWSTAINRKVIRATVRRKEEFYGAGSARMGRRKLMDTEQIAVLETHLRCPDVADLVRSFADQSLDRGVRPGREQSYDHCYNFFADTEDLEADLEKTCAVLGFYLASWGMYRGSSFLLKETNSSYLRDVVRVVQERRAELARIDLDTYTEPNIDVILDAYNGTKAALQPGRHRHITLITKIMIAVFGCIPAFDEYFFKGFRHVLDARARLPHEKLTVESLQLVAAFYRANQTQIDALHEESRTVAFGTDTVTAHRLSKAKIVDMYCYTLGQSRL